MCKLAKQRCKVRCYAGTGSSESEAIRPAVVLPFGNLYNIAIEHGHLYSSLIYL